MISSATDLMVQHSRRAVTWSGTPYPVAMLAAASALAGVATALASVLYYDR